MVQSKTDPRVLRTRKLIMNSFIEISGKKEFKDITIKDITNEAMINRATFYNHFKDIYDLLEKALSEVLLINLNFEFTNLNEETLVNIFKSITTFQKSLSYRCHRGYEDTIARIIREQLSMIFYNLLLEQCNSKDEQSLTVLSIMLSWELYGVSVEWRQSNMKIEPEEFLKPAIPYILSGIDLKTNKQ